MIWELVSYETVNQIIIPSKDLIIYFTKEFYIYIFWISVQHFVLKYMHIIVLQHYIIHYLLHPQIFVEG